MTDNLDNQPYPWRQGDVYGRPITEIPVEYMELAEKNDGVVILAQGSSTGNKHAIYDKNATLFRTDDKMFLMVMKEVELKHEEHGVIPIIPGCYEVMIGREHNYRTGKAQQEID